jgi:MFS family permease
MPLPAAFEPFRHPEFSLYQAARILLIGGGQFVFVALGWQVYDLTGSNLHVGLIGLAQFLPNALLALFAGHAADRVDRRSIVVACTAASAAAAAVLAWQGFRTAPSLGAIYGVAAAFGVIRAFSAPAGHAFLSALVPLAILPRALNWHIIVFQAGVIIGPSVGGLLYAVTGSGFVYASAAVLYASAVLLLVLLERRPRGESAPEAFVASVRAGLRHVWTDRRLLGAMSLDLFAVLLGGATALLPALAKDVLLRGPEVLGLLRSAEAVGAAAMALLLAFLPLRRRIGLWLLGGVAVFGLATVVLGVSASLPLSVGCLLVAGAADMLSVTVRHTNIQVATPDAMRGRVGAVSMVFINASNELGEFESGVTAHWWGTGPAVVVGGLGTLAVVALWARLFPSLRKADRFEDAAPAG